MIEKICPDCGQRRPQNEIFCLTIRNGRECGWNLTDVPVDVALPAMPNGPQASVSVCSNGHPLNPGDYICSICGADPCGRENPEPPGGMGEESQAPYEPEQATVIGGWEVVSRLAGAGVIECFHVARDGANGILTLYSGDVPPDPAVDAAVDALAPGVTARVVARGEYEGRRYELVESADGRTLAEIAIAADESAEFRRSVHALGASIHAMSRAGLRHRDLRPEAIIPGPDERGYTICRFGFAKLSSHDLDTAEPQELSRYSAPELLAGAVSPASDWWSLGIILLEKLTQGACFDGINDQAFLMNVIANGAVIPAGLGEEARLLLRGLLARDRNERWGWEAVEAWTRGEPQSAPEEGGPRDDAEAGAIELGGKTYRALSKYALAAGRAENWAEARDQLARGVVLTWLEDFPTGEAMRSAIRTLMRRDGLDGDTRLMLGLKILNRDMPLVRSGELVAPGWLLQHPAEGYALISGGAPALLEQLGLEPWLVQLHKREADVRRRAGAFDIELDEQRVRVNLLCTSRHRLDELWRELRRDVPDSDHRGLASLMDRPQLSEEDVLILLSAGSGQFRPLQEVLREASELARKEEMADFDVSAAAQLFGQSRREIMHQVGARVENFARCGMQRIDEWVDQFRLERRTTLARAAVILAVPVESWRQPPGQEYVSQLLGFFEKRVNVSVSRGVLARMTITKTSPRLDLTEIGSERERAERLLGRVLERSDMAVQLDPAVFATNPDLEHRLRTLVSRAELLRREAGIDGLYMGFPFVLAQPRGESVKPRIAPALLWPIRIGSEVGQRGRFTLAFDRDREEVRINPALQNLFGPNELARWETARDNILAGATGARAVMDELGHLATTVRQGSLARLPSPDVRVAPGSIELAPAAVLFHVTFVGQAIVEDIRQLQSIPPGGTNLESLLRVPDATQEVEHPRDAGDDIDRYATAESDPTQDAAVAMARSGPGLVIEGPPGTGKSQTIVNMVADGIGRKKSILIICQKQAALDVVCKRLYREGLGERLVMVTDVGKDRRTVIQAVREQVESILANGAPDGSWQRKRNAVLDQIRRLEESLNKHQQAFHAQDDASGRTYRELVSELVALESEGVAGECLELREKLGVMRAEAAQEVTETCASLAPLWLPAEYEGSPLVGLRVFGWDQATLDGFHKDLQAFRDAERRRPVIARRVPGMIEFEHSGAARQWTDDARDRLCTLGDNERQELAHFIDLFMPAGPRAARSPELIRSLSELSKELSSLVGRREHPALDGIIATQSDSDLKRCIGTAVAATRDASGLWRLNPARFLNRRRLRRFLKAGGTSVDDTLMQDFLARAQLETHLRTLRTKTGRIYDALGFAQVELRGTSGGELTQHVDWLRAMLGRVAVLAALIAASPAVAQTLAAAKATDTDALIRHFADVDAAVARSDARSASRRALAAMERWCEPDWIRACEALIARDRATGPVLEPLVSALGTLPAYQQYRVRARDLTPETAALLAALRLLAPELRWVPPDKLSEAVRRVLRREARLGWKTRLEQMNPPLLLERSEIEERVRSLAEAEAALRELNKKAITANMETRRLGTREKWEDITRFTGPRRRTLREFVDLGWDIGLSELRPVWLMGPDVASRMLPLRPIFDLVIYDEASQMPVEFALPSLFRGKAVVVSGDDKQLPPTSFFANRVDSDEEETPEFGEAEDVSEEERRAATESWNRREIKDYPNLLELSKSVLRKVMLKVHYRSAYRELIAFSNNAFYDGALNVPVRHPASEVDRARPIEVVRVDGLYEDRTNEDEARKVVSLLARIWKEAGPPSIGVVTFNRDQADLIEQRLEERAEDDRAFRAAYRRELGRTEHGEDMRFFVKNVENVQGDERDHIIFSTTFGRNRDGAFRRYFGVLGQGGGERRLNVAVTRARRKVTVLTSMPVAEIAEALASGAKPQQPRDYLQLYLAYVGALSTRQYATAHRLLAQVLKDGASAHPSSVAELDGFARSVESYVKALGLTPEAANDQSAFGIDFAVRHPARETYGIGIECEGHRHAILARARAREIWRRTEMRKSIPFIHRVSLRGWYHDREAEQSRLRSAIEQALA